MLGLNALRLPVVAIGGLPLRLLLPGLLLLTVLAACGEGGGGGSPTGGSPTTGTDGSGTVAEPVPGASLGHFVGTVTIAGETLFADAFLTTDGQMRLYIGGPYSDSGALQMTMPVSSEQFVGSIEAADSQVQGSGIVIGQQCATDAQARFCSDHPTAAVSMSLSSPEDASVGAQLDGEMQVSTSSGEESWTLHLGQWPYDGSPRSLQGQFQELVAEFAFDDSVLVILDGTGALSFQSAHSGCTGSGMLGSSFDVTLTITNCSGAFGYLNGDYAGLATTTPSSVWDYDGLLRVWVSKTAGSGTSAAVTMLDE
jgi:hypothetical protein